MLTLHSWDRTQVSGNLLSITKHIYIMSIYTESNRTSALAKITDSEWEIVVVELPHWSKTQSKNESIVQSIVQSRVQSPGFTPTHADPNKPASILTRVHIWHVRNAVTLVWGSFRLAPIMYRKPM